MRAHRFLVSLLFFSASVCALSVSALGVAHAQNYTQSYDAESIVLAPPMQDDVKYAQANVVATPDTKQPANKQPVDYVADTANYDDTKKIVMLSGKVELVQEGRKLTADRVVYNLKEDIATAEGNVVITDVNGDVHHADSVELSDKMRKGLVDRLFTTMADGSRLWAVTGVKESETRYRLQNASYTACKACENDPDKRPPWQLHASEVKLLRDEQRVVYRNAWLDMWGVPVFYTPYFSHPDGTVEQKSGFLTPSFGYNSNLGGFYSQPYYWAISPSMDTTFTAMPTTDQGPLLRNELRKRYSDAYFETDASITVSDRTDSVGNARVRKSNEFRGHLFGKGGWDIDKNWRARAQVELTTDEQYLRQYGFSDDSILENEIYAERFEDRDYAIVKALAFQDIRTAKTDQPNVLPYGEISMFGDPNGLMGGRWQWDSSVLALSREGNGQDMWRASTRGAWNRQDVLPVGFLLESELAARADGYVTTDRIEHSANAAEPRNKQEARFIPSAQFTASYPLENNFRTFQLRVEPVATVYMAPNVDNDTSIPNEDSTDVQLDAGNILEGNRFTGLDRVEDKSHVAYGLRTGLYNYTGGRVTGFLGQSYDFDSEPNDFPAQSGLETQSSDYVGSVNASFDEGKHDVSYRFQVDSDQLASERHELYARTEWGPVEVDGYYLYAAGVPGTTYTNSREQLRMGSTVDLSDAWSVRGDAIYDLSNVSSERGLRRSIMTLNYEHECYDMSVRADRYLASATSGVQDTTITFRIGLKNLGEYQTKAFNINEKPGLP